MNTLRRHTIIFAVLTLLFWACALLIGKFEASKTAVWAIYAIALLFIIYGFLTIFQSVRLRVKQGRSHLATVLAVLAAFLFFSIGGPVFLAWFSLRASKNSTV